MMPYGWHDGGWGILWMILSWGAIAWFVVFAFRAFVSNSTDRSKRSEGPREILDARFARGEVSEEEYRDRKRVLDEAEH